MRHANKVLLMIVAAIACLAALYAGAYLANLDLGYVAVSVPPSRPNSVAARMIKRARYRVGGRTAEALFAPAQKLDAAVRPDEWENVTWSH